MVKMSKKMFSKFVQFHNFEFEQRNRPNETQISDTDSTTKQEIFSEARNNVIHISTCACQINATKISWNYFLLRPARGECLSCGQNVLPVNKNVWILAGISSLSLTKLSSKLVWKMTKGWKEKENVTVDKCKFLRRKQFSTKSSDILMQFTSHPVNHAW